MKHDELLDTLADAKESIYRNVNLGSPYNQHFREVEKSYEFALSGERYKKEGVPRADVIKINGMYSGLTIDIFEVKATRADFLSDIRTEKWKKYLPYCHRFYFACLSGITTKKEISELGESVGLYTYNVDKKTWSCIKASKKREIELDTEMLLSMLFYRQKSKEEKRWHMLSNWRYTKRIKGMRNEINEQLDKAYNLEWENKKLKEEIAYLESITRFRKKGD